MNFSIVLIARNESQTLPRLLASLEEFRVLGGEVVLVDTGSTDDTVAVATGLGCVVDEVGEKFITTIDADLAASINQTCIVEPEEEIVHEGTQLFDYSAARNYAAGLASNDIVWMPDCDEAFTNFHLLPIVKAFKEGAERLEYDFIFSHDQYGNPAIRFTHSKCYDRRKFHWAGIVHEVLAGEGKTAFLPTNEVLLEHFQEPSERRGRYLAGLALDCHLNPEKDRNSHYFARELLWSKRPLSAIKEFSRHIAMNRWVPEQAQSMIYIGDALIMLEREKEALVWYHRAFDTDGTRREPLIRLAEYWWRKDDFQKTAAYASAALTVKWHGFYANNLAHYQHIPHEMLYWALWRLGDKEGAKLHYDQALAYQPNNPKYLSEKKWFYPTELEWTGERYIPGKTPLEDVETEHLARYNFAASFTSGLKVLDAASGDGYGKTILAASEYQGCDIEPVAIKVAEEKYGPGYWIADLEQGLPDSCQVDAVVSFETIEHLHDPRPFLIWASRNSKLFIASIPLNMPSEFHHVVYTEQEAKNLIKQYWEDPVFFCQQSDRIRRVMNEFQYLVCVCGPKISIVIPTLGRPEKLKRLAKLIDTHAGYPNYEVLVENDSFEDRQGAPKMLKRGVDRSTGSLVMFLGNDCVPRPNFLLNALKAMIKNFPDMDGLVGLNDKYWHGEFATHWLASKKLLPMLGGEFFHTGYKHLGCDNELTERCKMISRYIWAEDAVVYHDHPVQSGFQDKDMDDVYRLAYDTENMKQDLTLLQERAKEFGFTIPDYYTRPQGV